MDDKEIRAQVDAFVALPRKERREKYNSLPPQVKLRARKIIEARRGIAYRAVGGIAVFTKEEYLNQLLRLKQKHDELPKRMQVIDDRMVELKKQLQENYGDEALAQAETALEAANA